MWKVLSKEAGLHQTQMSDDTASRPVFTAELATLFGLVCHSVAEEHHPCGWLPFSGFRFRCVCVCVCVCACVCVHLEAPSDEQVVSGVGCVLTLTSIVTDSILLSEGLKTR